MNYGYAKIIGTLTLLLFISSCSPYDRLSRLLDKHPYLLDSFRIHEIQVERIKETDTQFVWKKERDTITFRDYRLERFRDTIRFFSNSRNCTTNIYRTEIRPTESKSKEKPKALPEDRTLRQIGALFLMFLVMYLLLKK